MPKNILVIDDEELIIRSLTKLLQNKGFNVLVAKRGQDALIMAEEEEFGLIIADIRMPGMNGVEIVKAILEKREESKRHKTPVVFITGYADAEIEGKAKKLHPVAYIYKPFDISDIIELIKKVDFPK